MNDQEVKQIEIVRLRCRTCGEEVLVPGVYLGETGSSCCKAKMDRIVVTATIQDYDEYLDGLGTYRDP